LEEGEGYIREMEGIQSGEGQRPFREKKRDTFRRRRGTQLGKERDTVIEGEGYIREMERDKVGRRRENQSKEGQECIWEKEKHSQEKERDTFGK